MSLMRRIVLAWRKLRFICAGAWHLPMYSRVVVKMPYRGLVVIVASDREIIGCMTAVEALRTASICLDAGVLAPAPERVQ